MSEAPERRRVDPVRVFVLAGVVATTVVSFGPVIGQIALLATTAALLR